MLTQKTIKDMEKIDKEAKDNFTIKTKLLSKRNILLWIFIIFSLLFCLFKCSKTEKKSQYLQNDFCQSLPYNEHIESLEYEKKLEMVIRGILVF